MISITMIAIRATANIGMTIYSVCSSELEKPPLAVGASVGAIVAACVAATVAGAFVAA